LADANTDDNSNASHEDNLVDMDDLDSFENAFFNREQPKAEPEVDKQEDTEEEAPENEDDALATDDDKDAPEDESPEDEDQEEEKAEEPAPKKGKKSYQDRINELTAKARNEERRSAELERRLAELEARSEVKDEPKELREQLPTDAPSPDAKGEDGEPLYPLGEFDPKFIRELTKFTIDEERKAAKAAEDTAKEQEAKEEAQRKIEAAQEELKNSWVEKVAEAEKELPDLREQLAEMGEVFQDIEPAYGEYLASTIMSCDYGPQIMYYLSQNIGEAQKIVASGPAAATLAIGRLEARFVPVKQEEKRNTKKVSSAPDPAEHRTRGQGGKFTTPADTDDLDAFEKEFFKQK
jgi:hypothetical protein